MMVMSFFIIP